MRRTLVTAAMLGGLLVAGTATAQGAPVGATPATIAGATFQASAPRADAPKGVSPEVFYDAATKTYYLWTTSMPAAEYRSSDGVSWTAVADAQIPQGIDWSVVQEGPSSYRLYYAEMAPTTPGSGPTPPCTPGTKRLRYATSSDLVHWTTQPGVLLDDLGCGVPHVMKTADGRYFLYFNMGSNLPGKEPGVHIGTSSDGLTWALRDGVVANDSGLVDPAPIQMPDGTFLMVGSTLGGPGNYQHLQLLSSPDAVTWSKRAKPLYAPSASAFDPSVELVDGRIRVWFGYSPSGAFDDAQITDGVITLGTASAAAKAGQRCTKKGAVSGKLVCAKGKAGLVWVRK